MSNKYTSQITIILDTICPWTYIAKRQLEAALAQVSTLPEVTEKVTFSPLRILPYQLNPAFPSEPVNTLAWYRDNKFGGSEEKVRMFRQVMAEYGEKAGGITFKALAGENGTLANTFEAHRVIQQVQSERGPETAGRLLDALYRMYFEEGRNPSSEETLREALLEAQLNAEDADRIVRNDGEWAAETKRLVREQASEGVDSVPCVRIEGKRRDVTLVGARGVDEYVKALVSIAKESR